MIKTCVTFHYTRQLMGLLLMAYYNPYITGLYNPFTTQPTGISNTAQICASFWNEMFTPYGWSWKKQSKENLFTFSHFFFWKGWTLWSHCWVGRSLTKNWVQPPQSTNNNTIYMHGEHLIYRKSNRSMCGTKKIKKICIHKHILGFQPAKLWFFKNYTYCWWQPEIWKITGWGS